MNDRVLGNILFPRIWFWTSMAHAMGRRTGGKVVTEVPSTRFHFKVSTAHPKPLLPMA